MNEFEGVLSNCENGMEGGQEIGMILSVQKVSWERQREREIEGERDTEMQPAVVVREKYAEAGKMPEEIEIRIQGTIAKDREYP